MPFTIGGEWISEPAHSTHKLPIKITKEKRRNSYVTLILNFSLDQTELKALCSTLKQSLGWGGSVKEGSIELQGDQIENVKTYFKEIGVKFH